MTTPSHIAQDIIRELEPVLARHPDSMRFARLADAYIAIGRPDKAVELCEQGLRHHPRYVTGKIVLAKALLAQGEHTKALHTLKSLLDLDPRHPLGWKYYGDLQKSLGKEEAAERSYSELLAIDALNEDVRAMLNALRQQRLAPPPEEAPSPPRAVAGEAAAEPALAEAVEDRFSYILDDIFSEEEGAAPTIENEEQTPGPTADLQDIFWPEPEPGPVETAPVPAPPPPPPPVEEEAEPLAEELFEAQEETAPPPPQPEAPKPVAEPAREAPKAEEERMVTPTLGEIYAAQGQYAKAMSVFTILARKHPDNPRFRQRIEELQRKLEESTGREQEEPL
ncbi:MAG: tetratricopeptide repeat protein [bacterium]|jgi:tetratricopeptide (TPR) repeat protein|nr:tetratricopeptide repeat protein [candidate division KSB1 bacterium]MDH7560616.1 tetratricopeptide repeat protein [bacterium]